MIRTQIQLTEKQARALRDMAAREGKSIAELIRTSVDDLIQSNHFINPENQRRRAKEAAGRIKGGPADLSTEHDQYLAEAMEA